MGSGKFGKFVVGVASAMAIATSAYAADAVVYEQPPELVTIEPGFTWTGLYIGANVGYSWGDFDHTATFDPFRLAGQFDVPGLFSTDSSKADGITEGGQIGYNWQANNLVFGVEADIQAADLKGLTPAAILLRGSGSAAVSTELDWFGTVRGRLGFVPTERLMVYGTGGLAYGRTTSSASLSSGVLVIYESTSDSKTRVGWTAGGGAEYAFTDHWSFKGEYLYTDLGDYDFYNFRKDDVNFTLNSDVKFHTVRVGVNYKF